MSVEQYLDTATALGLKTICLTNHGDIDDAAQLARLAPPELRVIPGVEISSADGDFLIFSDRRGIPAGLEAVQALPDPAGPSRETAVVWAHPFAGNPGGLTQPETISGASRRKWTASRSTTATGRMRRPANLARSIAAQYGLAELGGSDAHGMGELMRCWTETVSEIRTASI